LSFGNSLDIQLTPQLRVVVIQYAASAEASAFISFVRSRVAMNCLILLRWHGQDFQAKCHFLYRRIALSVPAWSMLGTA
jgi:hypothetical protein